MGVGMQSLLSRGCRAALQGGARARLRRMASKSDATKGQLPKVSQSAVMVSSTALEASSYLVRVRV